MTFGFAKSPKHAEVNAGELAQMLGADSVLLVDVREADEFAAGHIPGAINMPLSVFRADQLSDPLDRKLVLSCLGGKRSAMALDKCREAGVAIDTHLAGGFGAWKSAGLPVER